MEKTPEKTFFRVRVDEGVYKFTELTPDQVKALRQPIDDPKLLARVAKEQSEDCVVTYPEGLSQAFFGAAEQRVEPLRADWHCFPQTTREHLKKTARRLPGCTVDLN